VSAVVSRTYVSQLRESQARATRRAIVAAAGELFIEGGYSAATIAAIAERAGVSRRTVFSSVGGKPALLKLAWDWAIAGDDEPVPMAQRPAVKAMLAETNPATLVHLWVAFVTEVAARAAPIGHVVDVAADIEPEVAELTRQIERQRLQGAQAFIDHLADVGGLRNGITRALAADWCWAHMSPTFYRLLVLQQGWSRATFEQWFARSLAAALLPTMAARAR
jgi:AcrR family transcriptional regulator